MIYFKKLKFRLLIFLSFIGMNTYAQIGSQIEDVDVLAEQKRVMIENYPGQFREEEIIKVEKKGSKRSIIYYTRNNVNFEAVVNSDRRDLMLIATCEEIPESKLPAIVKDNFLQSKSGENKIEKVFLVTTPISSIFYRIDITPKGKYKKMKSLFYSNRGSYMKPPY